MCTSELLLWINWQVISVLLRSIALFATSNVYIRVRHSDVCMCASVLSICRTCLYEAQFDGDKTSCTISVKSRPFTYLLFITFTQIKFPVNNFCFFKIFYVNFSKMTSFSLRYNDSSVQFEATIKQISGLFEWRRQNNQIYFQIFYSFYDLNLNSAFQRHFACFYNDESMFHWI